MVPTDWETRKGLNSNIFVVCAEALGETDTYMIVPLPAGTMALRERLKGEPVFVEVMNALRELGMGVSKQEHEKARHRAEEYFIDDGKLWQVGGGRKV
ncbi:hypothetical protein K438DRAFT_1588479 [Mycena galopus ATCC 62051]|nr:hypothetical protein K438DRAFT_1588479 [Mycena galopus ATCC 62051]